jgi:tellurium resistance protein TerD
MAIPFKGGNISLTKTDPTLKNLIVGLGWDVRETDGENFDLDASLLMVKADGKARSERDFIYYHQKSSACGAVHHTGDNRTGAGEGDDESIHVFLDKVPADINKLVVCVSIYEADKKKQNFGQVLNAFIRLVNKDTHEEVTRYDLSENASTHTAMIFGELYRYDGEWKFRAVGQGFPGGLAELVRLHGIEA